MPSNPRLLLDWRAADGQVLDTSTLPLPVQGAGWQSAEAIVQAPAGTVTVSMVLVGSGAVGTC